MEDIKQVTPQEALSLCMAPPTGVEYVINDSIRYGALKQVYAPLEDILKARGIIARLINGTDFCFIDGENSVKAFIDYLNTRDGYLCSYISTDKRPATDRYNTSKTIKASVI